MGSGNRHADRLRAFADGRRGRWPESRPAGERGRRAGGGVSGVLSGRSDACGAVSRRASGSCVWRSAGACGPSWCAFMQLDPVRLERAVQQAAQRGHLGEQRVASFGGRCLLFAHADSVEHKS